MKKLIAITLAVAVLCGVLALTSCDTKYDKEHTIVVGASATPHAEILDAIKEELKKQGYLLDVKVYNDYVLPNTALEDGSLDANYFQHVPYLTDFNANNGTHIVSAGAIHYEPIGLYGKDITTVAEIPDGATIVIPADGSNCTRALFLLQQAGLVTLNDGVQPSDTLSKLDIKDNPHNYNVVEVEASTTPAQLNNANKGDAAVINGNYALDAGISIANALATEDPNGPAAQLYANIIAVREGDEKSVKTLALLNALTSDAVRDFINDNYNGAVKPIF